MSYTRAQFATAVDAAHAELHLAAEYATGALPSQRAIAHIIEHAHRAHEHLHAVGAGIERVQECGTRDPEAQRILSELMRAMDTTILPGCGHRFSDLIAAPGTVTKCGACLMALYPRKESAGGPDR